MAAGWGARERKTHPHADLKHRTLPPPSIPPQTPNWGLSCADSPMLPGSSPENMVGEKGGLPSQRGKKQHRQKMVRALEQETKFGILSKSNRRVEYNG